MTKQLQQMPAASIVWHPVSTPPPAQCGWYLAAILPPNHASLSAAECNSWRASYGCCHVWYNKDARPNWWRSLGGGAKESSEPLGDRITHWANCPVVPEMPDTTCLDLLCEWIEVADTIRLGTAPAPGMADDRLRLSECLERSLVERTRDLLRRST